MILRGLFILIAFLSFFEDSTLYAQNPRPEYPVKHFSSNEYAGHPVNYAVEINENGQVFFANIGRHSGLVMYSDQKWQNFSLRNGAASRSLALGNKDTLYIGGENEFGYFSYDKAGEYNYNSLSESLPDSLQDFDLVFFVHKSEKYTLFNALTRVFVYEGTKFIKHFDAKRFGYSSVVDGELWLKNIDTYYKFKEINGELQLSPIPDLDLITNRFSFGALPISDTSYVFGLSGSSPVEYSSVSKKLKPLEVSNIDQLSKDYVLSAGKLKNGRFYISGYSSGLYIYNAKRELIQHIRNDDNSTIFNSSVNDVDEDRFGNVWMALRNGITVARPFSPVQKLWSGTTFDGTIQDILEFDKHLYVSTNKHIYQAEISKNSLPVFKQISTTINPSYQIKKIEDDLFFSSDLQGIKKLNPTKNTLENVLNLRVNIQYIEPVPDHSLLIGSAYNTIVLLQKQNGKWSQKWISDKFPVNTYTIKHDKKLSTPDELHFWVGTTNHGLYYFTVNTKDFSLKQSFTKAKTNLPQLNSNLVKPVTLFNEVYISNGELFYSFIEKKDGKFWFEKAHFADTSLSQNSPEYFFEKSENEIWTATTSTVIKIVNTGNTFEKIPYPELNSLNIGIINKVITDSEGHTWIAGFNGIARFSPDNNKDSESPLNTFVSLHSKDSLLFSSIGFNSAVPVIPFDKNSIQFEFSSDWYHPEVSPNFSWNLQGYNTTYSPWKSANSFTLENLAAGEYTLNVKSRGISGAESSVSSISFTIQQPWYATGWMWIVYIVSGSFLVFGLIQWRSYSLIQKRKLLEAEVQQRTKEVVNQKKKIEDLVQELQRIDALKSEYFANISHEFRTPLTLMLNPLEEILKTAEIELPEEWKQKLIIVSRNTKRLKKLVDEILDLIKLESGILSLNNSQINLHSRTKFLVSSFSSFADSKDIDLKFESAINSNLFVELDDSKYEHIINNLISNALKFTAPKGKVLVRLKEFQEQIMCTVTDTGVGISSEDLPHIFNRFYKAGKQDNRYEGLGIGLALSSQLSGFLGGSLSAKSELNQGSIFTLLLPLKVVEKTVESKQVQPEMEELSEVNEQNETSEKTDFNENILIIEDNEDMRNFVRSLLEKRYTVKTAKNGIEGLKELESNNVSLVISDIMMPEMDGMSFAKQVRKQSKFHTTPIIFLSARADISDQIDGLRLGVEDYLVKPFNNEELLVRIENLLENRRRIVAAIESNGAPQESSSKSETDSDQFLQKVKDLILQNISESEFNVSQLAGEVFLSERQLSRKLKSLTGCTPAEYIKQVKLHHARLLLEQKKYTTVTEIATAVGYSKTDYFSKIFKSTFGRSPSTFF